MAYDYGYGELENQIVEIFQSVNPDFNKAKALVNAGANLNAQSSIDCFQEDTMLKTILLGFWETNCDKHETCEKDCLGCTDCIPDDEIGQNMQHVIQFFLENGFDVSTNNNNYGAQCLYALTLATLDKYILPCAKLLLDAGAKDIAFYRDNNETVSEHVDFESFFQSMEGNQDYSNILEAYRQILIAANEGRNYHNIDGFDASCGKKLKKVYALPIKNGPVFYDLNMPEKSYHNCYNTTLFFVYEGGAIVNTQYAEIWTDASPIPDTAVDVSSYFKDICGAIIKEFSFSDKTIYKGIHGHTQPIIYMHMDNEITFKTTINFGEVPDDLRAAYYELVKEEK